MLHPSAGRDRCYSNYEEQESSDESMDDMQATDGISPFLTNASGLSSYRSSMTSYTGRSRIRQNSHDIIDETEMQETSAKSVTIEGAVGIYANLINACFVQNGEMYNNRMLYQSFSNPGYWLWYTRNGRWMVSSTKDKDLNMECGFCHCKAFGLPDPSHTKGWFVLGSQGRFRRQTRVAARKSGAVVSSEELKMQDVQVSDKKSKMQDVQVSDKELKQQDVQVSSKELKPQDVQDPKNTNGETQLTQDALPIVVKFQGVTGFYASAINGVYMCKKKQRATKLGESIEDKKIFYRHQSQSYWRYITTLVNGSSGNWMVLRDNQVLAYCELAGLADPCDAKRWHTRGKSNASPSSFSVQPNVNVKRVDTKDLPDLPAVRVTKPSFRSSMFGLSTAPASSIFVATDDGANDKKSTCTGMGSDANDKKSTCTGMGSDAKDTKGDSQNQFQFYHFLREPIKKMREPIKKKITPYMKALKKLKSQHRGKQ